MKSYKKCDIAKPLIVLFTQKNLQKVDCDFLQCKNITNKLLNTCNFMNA